MLNGLPHWLQFQNKLDNRSLLQFELENWNYLQKNLIVCLELQLEINIRSKHQSYFLIEKFEYFTSNKMGSKPFNKQDAFIFDESAIHKNY